ncbi:ribonuclease Z [Zhouia sp. PK063]|uniref:ribonuclease Z n=1 Tax=Zhouia sp. PK063 TaxID=3373602 RepID=UPI003787632D
MMYDKQENTSVFTREKTSFKEFKDAFDMAYSKAKNDNVIINLFSIKGTSIVDITEFLEPSQSHRENGKSFVIVAQNINFNDVPDELVVVPTLQEAKDIIEMEEIERDLGF